jgi:opacity protein-like surface antigen
MTQCKAIAVAAAWLMATAGSALAADPDYPQESFYLRGDAGWSWLEPDDFNLLTLGAGIGYQHNAAFRTDLRFDYGFAPESPRNGDKIATVTANGYLDLPLDAQITPYVGAGIGYGFVDSYRYHLNGFVGALTGGLTFDLSRDVAVDVGYRYRAILVEDVFHDHSVTTGLRFKF